MKIMSDKYTEQEIYEMKLYLIHEITSEYTSDEEIINMYERMRWKEKQKLIDNFTGYRKEE